MIVRDKKDLMIIFISMRIFIKYNVQFIIVIIYMVAEIITINYYHYDAFEINHKWLLNFIT